jgi:S-disulfanyl-L-cysteine oxidoreductase SoxD
VIMELTRPLMRSGFLFVIAAAFCGGLAVFEAHAQTRQSTESRQSVWDGVYTDTQADRGKGQYGQHCAVCHGLALEGNGESPPLVGEFIPDWAGTTLSDLYDKIETTMPLNAPGTLRPAIAADVLAYILKENNFPAGANELDATAGALGRFNFDVKRPPGGDRQ